MALHKPLESQTQTQAEVLTVGSEDVVTFVREQVPNALFP
jgi:hypothetical protein